jgi:hypothetical protein
MIGNQKLNNKRPYKRCTSSMYVMVNVYQRQYVYSMCGGDRDVTTYNGKFTMGKLKSSRLS